MELDPLQINVGGISPEELFLVEIGKTIEHYPDLAGIHVRTSLGIPVTELGNTESGCGNRAEFPSRKFPDPFIQVVDLTLKRIKGVLFLCF